MFRLDVNSELLSEWRKDTSGKIEWYGMAHPDYRDGARCKIGDAVFYVAR